MNVESFVYWPGPGQRCRIGGYELHCGDVFQIQTPDGWRDTRIELGGDWLLMFVIPARADAWDGRPARRYDP